jgi:hypothetical protein
VRSKARKKTLVPEDEIRTAGRRLATAIVDYFTTCASAGLPYRQAAAALRRVLRDAIRVVTHDGLETQLLSSSKRPSSVQ